MTDEVPYISWEDEASWRTVGTALKIPHREMGLVMARRCYIVFSHAYNEHVMAATVALTVTGLPTIQPVIAPSVNFASRWTIVSTGLRLDAAEVD